jgi:D-glycero-alpha-D-manno-heptose-7-phosphate kinase
VDDLYAAAREAGARGGKLLGAGGGGFMLFFVPPAFQAAVKAALHELIWVPFAFDTGGSQIIFYSPEQDYADLDQARAQEPPAVFKEAAERAWENAVSSGGAVPSPAPKP